MTTFQEFGLPKALAEFLAHLKYTIPTPIQAQTIPLSLKGRDILGSAQTGTGKTMAFVLPMLHTLMTHPTTNALVMVPTRELAIQVIGVIHQLCGKHIPLPTALIIGGDPMPKQLKQLKAFPRVIVGTPGRINDHLKRHTLKLDHTSFLVLDETDRMLDMGFGVQIETIIAKMPAKRQTLMFSATLPKNIVKASEQYLKNPERVELETKNHKPLKIKQDFIHISEDKKYLTLTQELTSRTGSVILFVKTKRRAEKITKALSKDQHSANYIHGDLRQRQREQVIKKFRDYEYRIMVATDVAARGLDIPHIEHVINYDLPQCPEDYIHRIGRTGRAGAEGASLCLISPEDHKNWRELQKYLNPDQRDKVTTPSSKPAFKKGFSGPKKRRPPQAFKGRQHRK